MNSSYRLDEKKVVDTIKVEDLGAKTVLCRCWQSKKFPLCDGRFLIFLDLIRSCFQFVRSDKLKIMLTSFSGAHGKHNQKCGDNLGPVVLTKAI